MAALRSHPRLLLGLLLLLAGLALGCALRQVLPVPGGPPTPAGPLISCTPPACALNESYHCAQNCPGGCGTTCATHTPDPSRPTPTIAPMVYCAPSLEETPPGDGLAPRIGLCASAEEAAPDAVVVVVADLVGAEWPLYLETREAGGGSFATLARVEEDGRAYLQGYDAIFELQSAHVTEQQVTIYLRAAGPGTIELRVAASNPAPLESSILTITITEP